MAKSRGDAAREIEPKQSPEMEEVLGQQEQETGVEQLKVGAQVEVPRVDGGTSKDAVVASGEDGLVLARKEGEAVLLRATDGRELGAEQAAARQLDLFDQAYESAADSAVKAAGLKGEQADAASRMMGAKASGIIAEALATDHPEQAIAQSVQGNAEAVKADESELKAAGIARMMELLNDAKRDADGATTDEAYNEAVLRIRAAERALFELRGASQPEASEDDRSKLASEAQGYAEVIPDPIYNEGVEAVQVRLDDLEAEMKKADQTKDEVAWTVAREEYERHRALMPILEKADEIMKAQQEVAQAQAAIDARVEATKVQHKAEVGAERGRVRAKRSYWNRLADGVNEVITGIENAMRSLDQGPASAKAEQEYAKFDAERKAQRAKLEEVRGKVQGLSQENEVLKGLGVELDFETTASEAPIDAAREKLYQTLKDMHNGNPEGVLRYVRGALKSPKTPEANRVILEAFQTDAETGFKKPEVAVQEAAHEEPAPEEATYPFGQVVNIRRTGGQVEAGWNVTVPLPGGQFEVQRGDMFKTVARAELDELNGPDDRLSEPEAGLPEINEEAPQDEIEGLASPAEQKQGVPKDEFSPKPYQPLDAQELSMRDLRESSFIQEGGDLKALERTFVETLIALEAIGMKPEDEGLPRTFQEMLDTKSSRGFFGKLVRAKTDRVKLFEKLAEVHYNYIDSGQVDVSEYLARQQKSYEEYAQKMINVGRRG
ncbi:hypothetical protein HZA85_00725 [Candidatus Uhrbacteria bacterium]|nr:hypothetical protein [Candidatus Uhrbacteria bacterium]